MKSLGRTTLVSGAGIAGPLVADLLAGGGFDVTVVEIAAGVRPGGQAVDIRGAARTVLDRMGLLDEIRSAALNQRGIADVDRHGRHLTEMTVELFGGDGIISEIEILRGELAEILVRHGRDRGVDYRFGTRIERLAPHENGVDVTLSDGTTGTFEVVIGADGPHSATRRMAFGPEARYARPIGGYMSWFSAGPIADLDGWYCMYNEPGGLAASLRPGRSAEHTKASLAFASAVPIDCDRKNATEQKALIAKKFADSRWLVPELLRAAAAADDFYFDALVQVRMDRWDRGRIALVGDAAWCPTPLTGLGTSLAVVGAYVLAGELAGRDDIGVAMARYNELVRPYVNTGQKLPPRGMKGYAPGSAAAIRARILSTRLMVSRPLRGLTKRLMFERADAIGLPAYPALLSCAGAATGEE